ncbi:preprotein translocase subunit SecE [Peptostreptococcus sp. D1]|uniref:preprotein translocase subunit SecE n=1 Tax=Peptostreptococcus sp. D1 TaxID=72304 RepID=UPI001FA88686|nr:preprotein translocase subunit SecE [Peptostreptococcus sp. D1]
MRLLAKENVQVSEENVGFVKGTFKELKQVTWPTKGELARKTSVVLAVVILATFFVWLVDTGLSQLLALLIKG